MRSWSMGPRKVRQPSAEQKNKQHRFDRRESFRRRATFFCRCCRLPSTSATSASHNRGDKPGRRQRSKPRERQANVFNIYSSGRESQTAGMGLKFSGFEPHLELGFKLRNEAGRGAQYEPLKPVSRGLALLELHNRRTRKKVWPRLRLIQRSNQHKLKIEPGPSRPSPSSFQL